MICSYCNAEAEIVKSFPSESTSAICGPCMSMVTMVSPSDMFAHGIPYDTRLVTVARNFLSEPRVTLEPMPLAEGEVAQRDMAYRHRDWTASRNRFRSLVQTPAKDWMPIKVRVKVSVVPGKAHERKVVEIDGIHRLCLAIACGVPEIPCFVVPSSYRVVPPDGRALSYQTLVLPDGIMSGERPADRWPLIPYQAVVGRSILDLACNNGVDGTMLCHFDCFARYVGLDRDEDAIRIGKDVATAWNVSDRAEHRVADVNEMATFPRADVVWMFSAAKVIRLEAFFRAVNLSGAESVIFESHNLHDDEASAQILALPWEWRWLGSTATVCGGPNVRRVWIGKPKS